MSTIPEVRAQFPILTRQVHGQPLVYLDNAATTQKPKVVLEAMDRFYRMHNANIHRGVHCLSQEATELYEDAREQVRSFMNAYSTKEIIFTRNATEGFNLLAHAFGAGLVEGDEICVSYLEHHANIVPWQMLCERRGVVLKVLPLTPEGDIDMTRWEEVVTKRTKLISITHVSNAIGTVVPIKEIIDRAHSQGILVAVDGSQAVARMPVDVQELDVDFYIWTGHKLYGPTGIGVLYGKEAHLEKMPPFLGGGDMIRSVSFEKTTYAPLPAKFEAGTPPIAEAIGVGVACGFVREVGFEYLWAHEQELLQYWKEQAVKVPGLRCIGAPTEQAAASSFVMEDVHPHDVGTILDAKGVAIRTGQHCAEPLMGFFGVPATSRVSFSMYSTMEEVDLAVAALQDVYTMFH